MIHASKFSRKSGPFTWFAILILLLPLLAACVPSTGAQGIQLSTSEQPASPSPVKSSPTPKPNETGENKPKPVPSMPNKLQPVAPTPGGTQVTGEVPQELLDLIIADLVEKLGIKQSDIQVIQAEAVTWRDGSLGCPKPGRFYTQALVDGYKVVLEANNVSYDYHAGNRGNFILCQPDLTGTP